MIRYAVWYPDNRHGEFQFLSSTQSHWTIKKSEALSEALDTVEETMGSMILP